MLHALTCESLEGPLNISSPEPVTNRDFMKTLAQAAGRPLLLPVPARLLQIVYGQMASEILLSGCRVSTRKLQESGFTFRHPTLKCALQGLLGRQ
jgi:NAD dependent epimerase/dehydratase family enzyme